MTVTSSDDVQNIMEAAERFATERAEENLREKMRATDMQIIEVNAHQSNGKKVGTVENETGILLSPFVVEEYERILPGAAQRLLVMAEKEQEYRHDQEKTKLETSTRDAWVGLIFACTFILCIISLCIGAALAFDGMELAGSLISVGAFLGVSFVFASTVLRTTIVKQRDHTHSV